MDHGQSNGSSEDAIVHNDKLTLSTVLGAGFNAHSQVDAEHTDDVYTFTKIAENARIIHASWASTVLIEGSTVRSLGYQKLQGDSELFTSSLRGAFGNHERLLGCISKGGLVAIAQTGTLQDCILSIVAADGPLLSHVAMAGNGKIAVTYKQAPNGRLCHVSVFDYEAKFLDWLRDPSGEGNYPSRHHMLPGRPKQLLGTAVSFLLLMESGEVYSWGDARHGTLARSVAGEDAKPAGDPAAVQALGGLQIQKIACGGWMSAALSADDAVYVWGGMPPSAERGIPLLRHREASDVALVEIAGGDGEPLDMIDVAVGDAHIAVVSRDRRLFVAGSNSSGQVGMGKDVDFVPEWQAVPHLSDVLGVACGPKTTFVTIE